MILLLFPNPNGNYVDVNSVKIFNPFFFCNPFQILSCGIGWNFLRDLNKGSKKPSMITALGSHTQGQREGARNPVRGLSTSSLGHTLPPSGMVHGPFGAWAVPSAARHHCTWAKFTHAQWHRSTLEREGKPAPPSLERYGRDASAHGRSSPIRSGIWSTPLSGELVASPSQERSGGALHPQWGVTH